MAFIVRKKLWYGRIMIFFEIKNKEIINFIINRIYDIKHEVIYIELHQPIGESLKKTNK